MVKIEYVVIKDEGRVSITPDMSESEIRIKALCVSDSGELGCFDNLTEARCMLRELRNKIIRHGNYADAVVYWIKEIHTVEDKEDNFVCSEIKCTDIAKWED